MKMPKLLINFKKLLNIIELLFLLNICQHISLKYTVNADCGLPAVPTNAKIDHFKIHYYENETIEYYCELLELTLLGGQKRQCLNGRWNGTIPRCVEAIGPAAVTRMEITDRRKKLENITIPSRAYSSSAFFGDYSRHECIAPSNGHVTPLTILFILNREYSHVSYFELSIRLNKEANNYDNVIEGIVNSVRDCTIQVIEPSVSPRFLLRLSFQCDIIASSDDEAYYEYYNTDRTSNITVRFNTIEFSICEMKIYFRKFHRFFYCGSADLPLHSSVEYIQFGSKYGRMPNYRYTCDKNFMLENDGQSEVRCGINNNWIDPFPVCIPKVMCNVPPENNNDILTVQMSYDNLFKLPNGTEVATVGSKVNYACDFNPNTTTRTMIGDSIRVCTDSGRWSGIEPMCLDIDDLKIEKYSAVIDTPIATESDVPFTPNNDTLECGLPALPTYAKPSLSRGRMGSTGDFRMSYQNGTKIEYRCESAFHWMIPTFDQRMCINGKWNGTIGKCGINYGGTVKLDSVVTTDYKSGSTINEWHPPPPNNTDDLIGGTAFDSFASGECAKFNVSRRQKWFLKLNTSVIINGIWLRLMPGGIYGEIYPKRGQSAKNFTTLKPLRAKVGNKNCEINFLYDYPNFHTSLGFKCEGIAVDYSSLSTKINEIQIQADPKQFNPKYDTSNVSLCALLIYHTSEDCGNPDVPLHSIVTMDGSVAKFECEPGYELIGQSLVTCSRNGNWRGDFPVCKLKKYLCPMLKFADSGLGLTWTFKNTLNGSNGEEIPILGSIIQYQCKNVSQFIGRSIIIGSRSRICQSDGKWSGTNPYCIDAGKFTSESGMSSPSKSIAIISLTVVVIIAILGGVCTAIFHFHRIRRFPIFASLMISNAARMRMAQSRPESTLNISDMEINASLEQLAAYGNNRMRNSNPFADNFNQNSGSSVCLSVPNKL